MKCAIILLALTCGVLSAPFEDEALAELVKGNHEFSAGVFKVLSKFQGGNFIFSPFSAETILAAVHEGARGETETEFIVGLHLPSTLEKNSYAFKTFLPKLKRSEEDLKILSANKIYIADGVQLQDSFKDNAANIYYSGVENIDFAQSVDAANTINAWVEENTNNTIHDLVNPQSYDESTKILLVNSLYFSGEWVHQFNPAETKKTNFYWSDGDSAEVDTLFKVGQFNFYDHPSLNAQFVEIPYKGGDISFVIALPHEGEQLSNLEDHLEDVIQFHPFEKVKLAIEIPKFKTESEIQFVPVLENLGIQKAFHEGADFSGINSSGENLFIDDVLQKAYISINEAGSEVSAATAVSIATEVYDPSEPIAFKANRPFLYYITYSGAVIFAGRISNFSPEA